MSWLVNFIASILLWTIASSMIGSLIQGMRLHVERINKTKEKLNNLKAQRAKLTNYYLDKDGKLICEFDTATSRRIRDLQAKADALIAEGGSRVKLGEMMQENAENTRKAYSEYKTRGYKAEANAIVQNETRLNKGMWEYVNKRSIARALDSRIAKATGAIGGGAATLYELWPEIDGLMQALDDLNNNPPECPPSPSSSTTSSQNFQDILALFELKD